MDFLYVFNWVICIMLRIPTVILSIGSAIGPKIFKKNQSLRVFVPLNCAMEKGKKGGLTFFFF